MDYEALSFIDEVILGLFTEIAEFKQQAQKSHGNKHQWLRVLLMARTLERNWQSVNMMA